MVATRTDPAGTAVLVVATRTDPAGTVVATRKYPAGTAVLGFTATAGFVHLNPFADVLKH